jgi:putative endonuclease
MTRRGTPVTLTAREGERAVVEYLERRGYTVVDRNLRISGGEIDIVARKQDLVCIVEVKARRSTARGQPHEAVTARKRAQLRRLGRIYASRAPELSYRFDVASVTWKRGSPEIRYFENAFDLGDGP